MNIIISYVWTTISHCCLSCVYTSVSLGGYVSVIIMDFEHNISLFSSFSLSLGIGGGGGGGEGRKFSFPPTPTDETIQTLCRVLPLELELSAIIRR